MLDNNTKRIAKNSFILYIRMFITIIISLYSSRLVLNYLGATDYGIYNIVGGIVFMLGFLNTIMVSSTNRFITYEIGRGNEGYVNKIFSASLIIHISLSVLTLFVSETLGLYYIHNILNISPEKLADAVFVFHFSVITSIISIIGVPYIALMTAHEDFSFQAKINILQAVLTLGVSLLISLHGINSLRLYAIMLCLVFLIIMVMTIIYCRKKYSHIKFEITKDWSLYKSIVSFSSWIAIGAAAQVGRNQGSALILNTFFGMIVNAAFGISNQVNVQINQFAQNISNAFAPQITKNYGAGDINSAVMLTCQSCKYTFFILYIIALPILIESEYIFNLWLRKPPQYTVIFCQLMIVESLIINLNISVGTLVFATGKIKYYQLYTNAIYLLNLPISFLLFNFGYPPYAIIIGSIISVILMIVTRLYVVSRLINFNVKIFIQKIYIPAIISIIPTLPLFIIPRSTDDSFIKAFLIIICSLVVCVISFWFLGINNKERMNFIDIIKSKLKKVAL